MELSRRSALTGLAATGVALGTANQTQAGNQAGASKANLTSNGKFDPPFQATRPDTLNGLLLNRSAAELFSKKQRLIC